MRKLRWPQISATTGLIATALSLLAAALTEHDYLPVEYGVIPLLLVGLILMFAGTVALALRLERGTRLALALGLLCFCLLVAMAPLHLNIHGPGVFLMLAMCVAFLLGVVLLVMVTLP